MVDQVFFLLNLEGIGLCAAVFPETAQGDFCGARFDIIFVFRCKDFKTGILLGQLLSFFLIGCRGINMNVTFI